MSIGVLLADDQAMVRTGFRMILESDPDIGVVGEAANGEQAAASARRLRPDVVLMDIQMPDVDGLEATRRITADPDLAQPRRDPHDVRARRVRVRGPAGGRERLPDQERAARGAVARGPGRGDRRRAARAVGHAADHRAVRARAPSNPELGARLESLTHRELEVLQRLASGKSNAELAAELFVTEGTIKTHVSSLLTKLGLRDRVQAVVLAYESGLVTPGS